MTRTKAKPNPKQRDVYQERYRLVGLISFVWFLWLEFIKREVRQYERETIKRKQTTFTRSQAYKKSMIHRVTTHNKLHRLVLVIHPNQCKGQPSALRCVDQCFRTTQGTLFIYVNQLDKICTAIIMEITQSADDSVQLKHKHYS